MKPLPSPIQNAHPSNNACSSYLRPSLFRNQRLAPVYPPAYLQIPLSRSKAPPSFLTPTTSQLLLIPPTTFNLLLAFRWCVYFPQIRSGVLGTQFIPPLPLGPPTASHLSFPRPNRHHSPPTTSSIRTATIPLEKLLKIVANTTS